MSAPQGPELRQIYRHRFQGKSDYRNRVWSVLSNFFAQWIQEDAAVLDVGCGHCEFVNNIRAGQKIGMDLNPDAASHAAAGVRILEQNCSERWQIPLQSLDVVFSSNFFEHLAAKVDLKATLTQAYGALKPGGRLIAMGPNIKFVPGEYWDFFDHYLPLTELSLAEVLTEIGFQIDEKIPRFLPYTMSNGFEPPTWTLSLYLKMPLAWRFFGKQFLVIAHRPA